MRGLVGHSKPSWGRKAGAGLLGFHRVVDEPVDGGVTAVVRLVVFDSTLERYVVQLPRSNDVAL